MQKNSEALEKAADMHRQRLGETLETLASTVAPDRLAQAAVGDVSTVAQTALGLATGMAKRNPVGASLLGLGLAIIALQPATRDAAPGSKPEDNAHGAGQQARDDDAPRPKASSGPCSRIPEDQSSGSHLRDSLEVGLGRLDPEARARVTKARMKAIEAQDKLDDMTRRARDTAGDAHRKQPLVTSLAVAALGAVIGVLLPSTRVEQELMGTKRDQLLRDAEAALRAELEATQPDRDARKTG